MARQPSTEETNEIIRTIENIRINNNNCWMDILRIAIQCDPTATRKITKRISKNDKEVTKWLGKL